MQGITIMLNREDAGYVPGEPITGSVEWDLQELAGDITVRLIWQTSGKGTQDVGVVAEQVIASPALRGQDDFAFDGVEGPYSFSGKLITVQWLVEAFADKDDAHAEQALAVSPTGAEVQP